MNRHTAAMNQSTGGLLKESWGLLWARRGAIFIALIAFTMLLAVNQAFFARLLDERITPIQAQTGLTGQQFERQLIMQLQSGSDQYQVNQMLSALRQSAETGQPVETFFPLKPDNAALYFILTSMHLIFLSALLMAAILFVSALFFLLVGLREGKTAYDIARELPGKIFPTFIVLAWASLRSFVWLPVAGWVAAVFLLPRFILAPTLFLTGQRGILSSVSGSMARTKGKWLAIVGSLLTLFLVVIVGLWGAGGVVDLVGVFLPKFGFLVWLFALEVAIAFMAVFYVKLSLALIKKQ